MKTELVVRLTLDFSVVVEHADDDEIDENEAHDYIEGLTPDDWCNFGAGPPDIEIDLEPCDGPRDPETEMHYRGGRFIHPDYLANETTE